MYCVVVLLGLYFELMFVCECVEKMEWDVLCVKGFVCVSIVINMDFGEGAGRRRARRRARRCVIVFMMLCIIGYDICVLLFIKMWLGLGFG